MGAHIWINLVVEAKSAKDAIEIMEDRLASEDEFRIVAIKFDGVSWLPRSDEWQIEEVA